MVKLERIIALATTSSVLVESLLIKRFLLGIAVVMVMAVVIGVIISALLIAGFYLTYRLWLEHGLDADAALLATGGMGAVFVCVFAAIIFHRMLRLHSILRPKPVFLSHISETAEAFVRGFLEAAGHKPSE